MESIINDLVPRESSLKSFSQPALVSIIQFLKTLIPDHFQPGGNYFFPFQVGIL